MKSSLIVAFSAILLLSGCQMSHQHAGSGPIDLSRRVEAHFQSYLTKPNGEFFAISTDGKHYGYSVCRDGRFACVEDGDSVALRSCHSRSGGVPCKILAVGEDIVWQGATAGGATLKKVSAETGNGPITLSSRAKRHFGKYLSEPYPEYFAVSLDGKYGGYSLCYHDHCDGDGLKAIAISSCVRRSQGRECKIYAFKGKVIWGSGS